jgi:hypothetical protein
VAILESEFLVQLIGKLDKRDKQEGLIIERFFQKTILPKLAIMDVSTDWIFAPTRDHQRRSWIRLGLKADDFALTSLEEEFIRAGQQHNSHHIVLFDSTIADPSEGLFGKWEVYPIEIDSVTMKYDTLDEKRTESYSRKINSYLSKMGKSADRSGPVEAFLEKLDQQELLKILNNRAVMNGCGIYTVDIDALGRDQNRLSILEFKRKDPTSGYTNVGKQRGMDHFEKLLGNIQNNDAKTSYPEIGKQISKHWSEAQYVYMTHCYGLDINPHCKTMKWCESVNISYHYIVWDHAKPGHLSEILTDDLQPQGSCNVYHRMLVIKTALGYSFTVGNDSGMFAGDKTLRGQLAFEKSKFTLLNMSRGQ